MSDPQPTTPPAPDPAAQPPAQPPQPGQPPAQPPEGQPPEPGRTYSQQELERIIAERVRRERANFGDYDDLKARSARLSEIEEASKSTEQRLRERAERAERDAHEAKAAERSTMIRAAIVAEASVQGAVDPMAVAALLPREDLQVEGETIFGVPEAVKALLQAKPFLKSSGAPRAGAEIAGSGNAPRTYTRAQLRDPRFFREHEADILAAQREGRIRD